MATEFNQMVTEKEIHNYRFKIKFKEYMKKLSTQSNGVNINHLRVGTVLFLSIYLILDLKHTQSCLNTYPQVYIHTHTAEIVK